MRMTNTNQYQELPVPGFPKRTVRVGSGYLALLTGTFSVKFNTMAQVITHLEDEAEERAQKAARQRALEATEATSPATPASGATSYPVPGYVLHGDVLTKVIIRGRHRSSGAFLITVDGKKETANGVVLRDLTEEELARVSAVAAAHKAAKDAENAAHGTTRSSVQELLPERVEYAYDPATDRWTHRAPDGTVLSAEHHYGLKDAVEGHYLTPAFPFVVQYTFTSGMYRILEGWHKQAERRFSSREAAEVHVAAELEAERLSSELNAVLNELRFQHVDA